MTARPTPKAAARRSRDRRLMVVRILAALLVLAMLLPIVAAFL